MVVVVSKVILLIASILSWGKEMQNSLFPRVAALAVDNSVDRPDDFAMIEVYSPRSTNVLGPCAPSSPVQVHSFTTAFP